MQKTAKRHQLNIKARKDDHSALEEFKDIARRFSSDYDALKYLTSLANPSKVVEFQKCSSFNEIPNNREYIECCKYNDKGREVSSQTLKREYCYHGCPKSSIVKVELNQEAKKARLEGEISTLEKKKQGIIYEIKELEPKLEEKRKEKHDLTEEIKNLWKLKKAENWLEQKKELEEKHKNEIDELKQGYEEKLRQKDEEILTLKSPPAKYSESEPETIEETMVHKETTFQRKVKREKAETEEPNQTVSRAIYRDYLKNAREKQFKNKEILCPMTNQYVSIIDLCFHECKQYLDCEYYPSLFDRKIPEGTQIREKATTHHEQEEQKT